MDARASIRSFVESTFFVDGFSDDDSFLETGIVDSLGIGQLVAFLEERFGIRIADEELIPDNLDSVASAAAYVERKLASKAA